MRTYIKSFVLVILVTALAACQAYDVKKAEAAFTGFEGNPGDFPENPDLPEDPEVPEDPEIPGDDGDLPPPPADDDSEDDDGGESSSSVASNDPPEVNDDDGDVPPPPPPPPADDDSEDDDEGEPSLPPVEEPDEEENNLQCHGNKKTKVDESDFEELALSLPDSCLAGFELNSPLPQKELEFHSLDFLGAQERVLEFQYASYLPPSSVRITGKLLNGETYTLFESCRVRTDIAPSGQKKDRPDEERIRHYRLNLRSGTISIKFEAVKQTPFYVRLLGLCDFDMIALRATPTERLNYVNSRN